MPPVTNPVKKLPKYKLAPVVEVVASVQFAELNQIAATHTGDLWDSFGRSEYPTTKELPPLPKLSMGAPAGVSFEVLEKPPLSRQWFISADETALIQFQRDRLAYNWRKTEMGDKKYPHYGQVIEKFYQHYSQLKNYLAKQKFSTLQVSSLELGYINIISMSDIENDFGKLGMVFRDLKRDENHEFLASPNKINLQWQFQESKTHALAYIQFSTTQHIKDGSMAIRLELRVEGNPSDQSNGAMQAWFDAAHEWIVLSFDDILTPAMHKKWGRYYA